MGHGIAYAAIAGGYRTRLYDVSQAAVDKGRGAIEQIARKGVELGKATPAEAEAMLSRLSVTTSLAEALADADMVIEAAPEKIDLKLQLFQEIERLAPACTSSTRCTR
jgi:3-hydroxybutyryl-CoA dehydrogenase